MNIPIIAVIHSGIKIVAVTADSHYVYNYAFDSDRASSICFEIEQKGFIHSELFTKTESFDMQPIRPRTR